MRARTQTFFLKLNNSRGSLFMISLLLMVVILILGAAFLVASVVESRTAERQRLSTQAFYLAEAGVEKAVYELRQDFLTDLSSPSWGDGNINGIDVSGSYVSGNPPGDYYPLLSASLGDGTYAIELLNVAGSPKEIWAKATGNVGGASHTIRIYAKIKNLSPWDNAIFAGTGSVTNHNMINGCVDVRGSVHILGTGLDPTDYAVELGGTAELIGNNYSGLDASLLAKIPALDTVVYNGETIETLNAELRVKNGMIGLDGDASAGQPDASGDIYKETIDGAYVTDGFGGNQAENNVYSDNGWSNPYDLGDSVDFPSMSDPFGGYASYQEYLKANALVIDDAATLTQLANLDSGSSLTVTDPVNNYGSISLDGSGNMTIDGIVYIDGGDFVMDDKNATFNYTGTGSIVSTGDIMINTNLVTAGNDSFPDNVVGFMTPNNITIGTVAQVDVMGLFYGESQINVAKQTNVLGTLVSNYFDVGDQVPNIYQVPETSANLPPGLIGQSATWAMSVISWQKI